MLKGFTLVGFCLLYFMTAAVAHGQLATSHTPGSQYDIPIRSLRSYVAAMEHLEQPACSNFFENLATRPGTLGSIPTIRILGEQNSPSGDPAIAVFSKGKIYLLQAFFDLFEGDDHPSQRWFLQSMSRWFKTIRPFSARDLGAAALLHEYTHARGGVEDDGGCPATNLLVTYSVLIHCFRDYVRLADAEEVVKRIQPYCKCGPSKKAHCSRVVDKLLCNRQPVWQKAQGTGTVRHSHH